MQLPDVALPDAQGEDLHAALPQGRRHGPGVPAIGVAVGDEENGFGGVGAGVAQDLLSGRKGELAKCSSEGGIAQNVNVAMENR